MKNYFNPLKIFILCLVAFSISFKSYSQIKIVTFKESVKMSEILKFNLNNVGIKANTTGGRVEIRVYAAEGYNFDHRKDNPSFIFGFNSTNDAGLNYVANSWDTETISFPWGCLGGYAPWCSEVSKNTYNSMDQKRIRNKLYEYYDYKFLELGAFGDFFDNGVRDGTIDLIVEIDYFLPGAFDNFQYDLQLPGFKLTNIINLPEPFGPLFIDTPYQLESMFQSNDRSTITNVLYKSTIFMYSYGEKEKEEEAYVYDALYDNGQLVSVFVVKRTSYLSDITREQADVIANDVASRLGMIPVVARKRLFGLVIYNDLLRIQYIKSFGVTAFASRLDGKVYVDKNVPTSVLFHEACHTSLDNIMSDPDYIKARMADPTSISLYAKIRPFDEEISESFVVWTKLRYRNDRFVDTNPKIEATMPNRIAYFDKKFTDKDMYPLVKSLEEVVSRESYALVSPSNGAKYTLGTTITFNINKTGGVAKPGVSEKISFQLKVNGENVGEAVISNGDTYQVSWTPQREGSYQITGSVLFADRYKSSVGLINITVSPPQWDGVDDYQITTVKNRHGFSVIDKNGNIRLKIVRSDGKPVQANSNPIINLFANGSPININTTNSTAYEKLWYCYSLIGAPKPISSKNEITGTIQFPGSSVISLKGISVVLVLTNTKWGVKIGSGSYEVNKPITFIMKRYKSLGTSATITNVNFYEGISIFPLTIADSFPQDTNFDNDTTTEVSRVWTPTKAGNFVIWGTITVNGELENVLPIEITVEDLSVGGGASRVKPKADVETVLDKTPTVFVVFPNPSDGTFVLEFDLKEASPASVEIGDMKGKLLYQKQQQNLGKGNNKLQVGKSDVILVPGLYLVKVVTNEFDETRKLIVN